jgi:hypothetical protein
MEWIYEKEKIKKIRIREGSWYWCGKFVCDEWWCVYNGKCN